MLQRTCGNQNIRITLCGAYGMRNLGDEAMRLAVIEALHKAFPDAVITTLTRDPHGENELYSFGLKKIRAALRASDALIFGGGSLLQNVTSHRSLYYYLGLMRMAKRCGCKVIFFGCGMGPLSGRRDRRLTAKLLNQCADAVCLRDGLSLELLRDIGVTKPEITVTADPALLLPPSGDADAFLRENGVSTDGRRVCFIVRAWENLRWRDEIGDAASLLRGEGFNVMFAVMSPDDKNTSLYCAGECPVLPYTKDPGLMAAILGGMDCVVSMRLHGLVLAVLGGTPCVGISYDPKTDGFARRAGIKLLSYDTLTAESIVECVHNAKEIQAADKLKAAARENTAAAVRIINKEAGLW